MRLHIRSHMHLSCTVFAM